MMQNNQASATIVQRTPEWHKQRAGRITGSRVGAILGMSPWQKPDDVLRAMVREYHGAPSEFEGNPATDHGTLHEQRALLCFLRHAEMHVEECGFFEFGEYMGASPDSLTSDGGVLELKVPFGLRKQKDAHFKLLSEQPHYNAQVQMEMLATGRGHAYFAQYVAPHGDPLDALFYVPSQLIFERVPLDTTWLPTHLPAIEAFRARYLEELDNPAHLAPLRVTIETQRAAGLLLEIDAIRAQQKANSAREEEIMQALITMAGGNNAMVHGRKLTKSQDGKSVAYAKAVASLAPDADLTQWTTQRPGGWRLS